MGKMKIVIAIDSFKGSMTTLEAGNAAARGVLRALPSADIKVLPLADGGEGTTDAILAALGGKYVTACVSDPLGRRINARYGIIANSGTAVIEMSAAAGITLLGACERDPMKATTYGVGEMILDAVSRGCRDFIVGIGGSATNDGGAGMLSALGFALLDNDGNQIPLGARGLSGLCKINCDNVPSELSRCRFKVACDVKNPLCGENGCSAVYGPQKGATNENIHLMDGWLEKFAALTKTVKPLADPSYPGSGAAGGIGFALMSYLGAELVSGIDLVISGTGLEKEIEACDLVITGEGRLDGQSVNGKAPIGVAGLAKKYNKTVIAFCGTASDDATACNDCGIDAFFPILRRVETLEQAMETENAVRNLSDTAEQVIRALRATCK